MINRGGENVYCVEVENALAGAPGVFEVAVVGVPDEMMGEKVGAVIVPSPAARVDVPAVLGYLARTSPTSRSPVRRGPRRAAAAQPGRQAAQRRVTRADQLGTAAAGC